MSDTILMWLLGALFALSVGGICAGAGFVLAFSVRFTRIETVISIISKKAAEILHSPTNHLKLDEVLDKFMADKLDAKEENKFLQSLTKLVEDKNADKLDRLAALLASAKIMMEKK